MPTAQIQGSRYNIITEISIIKYILFILILAIASICQLWSGPAPIAVMDEIKEVTRLLIMVFERFIPNTVKEKQ